MKSTETARQNLELSLSLIPERYKKGVQSADWATPAGSDQSEQNWVTGVQAAAADKRRQRAIQAVGNAAWQMAASTKGANNIVAGIRAGLPKYATNFGRVYQAFQGLVQLPPRTTDAMTNVDSRLKPVVRAWKQAAGKS